MKTDAEKVDTLYSGSGYPFIQSLKGIEAFTNLVFLDCRWNELDSLDLSQHKKLEFLDCSGMSGTVAHAPNGVNFPNVKKYISLPQSIKYLKASLTTFPSFNSGDLVNLESLVLGGGDYKELDLSKCSNLKEFTFYPKSKTIVYVRSLEQITDQWTKSDEIEYKVLQ